MENLEYYIEITNVQSSVEVDEERLREVISWILRRALVDQAEISVAIVDDPTIHELNREYLGHDHPTDVLSFVFEYEDGFLDGQIIVGGETAAREATHFGWNGQDELLLYIVHGTLHLVGYDDLTDDARAAMREAERTVLAQFGLEPRW
ncbi:MAG: rRNA maturation RNase YbeY [Planctomycetia bacterium]|jgi:probable rRNA maturation factor